jgi:hypothetical protein
LLLNIGYPSWITATFAPDVMVQFRKSFSGVAIPLRFVRGQADC